MSPALFVPSVSSMIVFDLAGPSFILLIAVAKPSPIAVPSSTIPQWTSFIKLRRTAWSVVIGHMVKLSPAKITKPILSCSLPETNCAATSFAASTLSGLKSRANILPEMSRASTISTPSVEEFCQLSVDWGRANAIIKRTTAKTRKTKLKCRR